MNVLNSLTKTHKTAYIISLTLSMFLKS